MSTEPLTGSMAGFLTRFRGNIRREIDSVLLSWRVSRCTVTDIYLNDMLSNEYQDTKWFNRENSPEYNTSGDLSMAVRFITKYLPTTIQIFGPAPALPYALDRVFCLRFSVVEDAAMQRSYTISWLERVLA
ncbi:Uncharacterized protein HZ326_6018 [Fusarium oxysporum f. sp. albedinis]|nr:Uncharacterized protein HZ326_6018 [Fusarium oxysporum f. sp. albedinis]